MWWRQWHKWHISNGNQNQNWNRNWYLSSNVQIFTNHHHDLSIHQNLKTNIWALKRVLKHNIATDNTNKHWSGDK